MLINQAEVKSENATSEQELLTIENNYWVGLAQDLEGLEQDPRFQRLILEGYFKDKAVNGVSLLALDSTRQAGVRSLIMEELVAVSALQDYFMTIKNLGSVPDTDEDEDIEG